MRTRAFTVFYLNLMFSAIAREDRKIIVASCFRPFLRKLQSGLKLGLHCSGRTLEILQEIDPQALEELQRHIQDGCCELVGGGYAQIVGPLAPAAVNRRNQELGIEVCEQILGVRPRLATINEMVWSGGILPHYIDAGFEAVLMEWNNPHRHHPEWDGNLRFHRQSALTPDGGSLPLLWVDTLPTQQFQRLVHGQVEEEDYLRYVREHRERAGDGFFCLYASDAEIFDYRPRRYRDEAEISVDGEWETIGRVLRHLQDKEQIELCLPSELLDLPGAGNSGEVLRLESASQPVPVKKQEKYTLNRWALTGRDDFNINTACHRMAALAEKGAGLQGAPGKKLCWLWSSDFRTHIEPQRWAEYRESLVSAEREFQVEQTGSRDKEQANSHEGDVGDTDDRSGGASVQEDGRYLVLENRYLSCRLDTKRGLALVGCGPVGEDRSPWIGTIPHGRFDDIRYAADFYSCNAVIERPGVPKISDLSPCKPVVGRLPDGALEVYAEIRCRDVLFRKKYILAGNASALHCKVRIEQPGRIAGSIRPMHMTFLPEAFDQESLFFATHNGGDALERFELGQVPVDHAGHLSGIVSARYGFGATGGRVEVGDGSRKVEIVHDPGVAALVPSIIYEPIGDRLYFLRLQYSAQELDETFVSADEPAVIEAEFEIRLG